MPDATYEPTCCEGEERGAKHTFDCPEYQRSVEAFRALALRCRCIWRGERCENRATQEDGLCNWCGNGRTPEQMRDDPKALIGPNGEFYGIGGGGQLHDTDPAKPASTPACWYEASDRTVLNA